MTDSMPQNMLALRKGDEIRSMAKDFKARVAAGELTLAQAIATCDLPISVLQLLTAAPRIGPSKAAKVAHAAGIRSTNMIFGGRGGTSKGRVVTQHERERLILAVNGGEAGATRVANLDRHQTRALRNRMRSVGCTTQQIDEVLAA